MGKQYTPYLLDSSLKSKTYREKSGSATSTASKSKYLKKDSKSGKSLKVSDTDRIGYLKASTTGDLSNSWDLRMGKGFKRWRWQWSVNFNKLSISSLLCSIVFDFLHRNSSALLYFLLIQCAYGDLYCCWGHFWFPLCLMVVSFWKVSLLQFLISIVSISLQYYSSSVKIWNLVMLDLSSFGKTMLYLLLVKIPSYQLTISQ